MIFIYLVPNFYNMFIRVKKVKKRSGKTYEYAHLVNGVWKRRKLFYSGNVKKFRKYNNSVHKYSGLLGRVYRFEKIKKEIDFDAVFGRFQDFVDKNDANKIYKVLIGCELFSRGFLKRGDIWFRNGLFVDLNRLVVHDSKKDAVIKLKSFGGYLCNLTLQELFNIKKIENRYDGIYLMKKIRSFGITLSADQFFILADKLLREN